MIPELGHFALVIALALSIAQAVLAFAGAATGRDGGGGGAEVGRPRGGGLASAGAAIRTRVR